MLELVDVYFYCEYCKEDYNPEKKFSEEIEVRKDGVVVTKTIMPCCGKEIIEEKKPFRRMSREVICSDCKNIYPRNRNGCPKCKGLSYSITGEFVEYGELLHEHSKLKPHLINQKHREK